MGHRCLKSVKTRIVKICKHEKLIIMINFDEATKESRQEDNQQCPQVPDPRYRILVTEGSGPGKPNALLKSNKPSTRY